ncbi:MAG: LuxR C-terminal-related transcriptional regulator [Pirellulaceae bacterium]
MTQQALSILLVDDNPHDRGIVRRELRHEFGELRFQDVTNESEFATAIDDDGFDIVITDYQIRWTDGLKVLRAVKERYPFCPVLMFTATGSEEIAVEAMKAGLDDYIIKNLHHTVRLRGAVRAALDHATTQRRATHLESRLQSLLTQLQVGAFSCALDGRFAELNPAMAELLGSDHRKDAREMTLASLFPEAAQADNFLRQFATDTASHQIELEIESPAGACRFLHLNARRVDVPGESPRIDGLLEDVTSRKRGEALARQSEIANAQIAMLSPREKEVLDEVVAGGMNKTIARRFDISEKTVERHRSSLMKKLRVRSVAELTRLAALAENASKKDS